MQFTKLKALILLLLLCDNAMGQDKSLTQNKLTNKEVKKGYQLLFDGETSNGWRSVSKTTFPNNGWEIKNGELRILPAAKNSHVANGGDIVTQRKFKYFDLTLDYKIAPGGNSGLKYFVTNEKGASLGLEFQILDDVLNDDAKAGVNGNHTSSSLYDMITAKKAKAKELAAGNWNNIRLVVYPNKRIVHYLNGKIVVDYIKGSPKFTALIAKSKYSKIPNFVTNNEGHLLLQDHGSEISFRNIKIKELN
ncbi:DUF1080 domain-containing protein [Pedobacter psychrodurus]|uniref:DUF1080 domain-containing protein n=1 Tax=Pedobacter psychrodurus TaxID=2530456 RepID=A0A4R0PYZ6_9SPHI|nr:DUF1080 domain-containing protein [Pedobacter psychrodurus]TCD28362.1 DUF1080 domain-containing protein [Pedobacter psychrodurus]